MKDSPHDHLLTDTGMASAREALIREHRWFLHVTALQHYDKIKIEGLRRHNPGCAAPALVIERLGATATAVVFFRPQHSFDTTPQRDPSRVLLAIERDNLPAKIGLDWSYDGCWNLARILNEETPTMTNEHIFCAVVTRWGSVMSYEAIPAVNIRVWTRSSSREDPSGWPYIGDTDRDAVQIF